MYNNYTNPYYTGYNGANFNANPYGSPSVQFNPNYAQNGSQGFGQQQVQQQQQQQAIEYVNGLEGAKAFLDDKDFDGEPEEKLYLYYKCIVEKE